MKSTADKSDDSNGKAVVKLKSLVKLRSFKNVTTNRFLLQSTARPQPEKLTLNDSSSLDLTCASGLKLTNASKTNLERAERMRNDSPHVRSPTDEVASTSTGYVDSEASHEKVISDITVNILYSGRKSTSGIQITANDADVKDNLRSTGNDEFVSAVKTIDSQQVKNKETNKELMKSSVKLTPKNTETVVTSMRKIVDLYSIISTESQAHVTTRGSQNLNKYCWNNFTIAEKTLAPNKQVALEAAHRMHDEYCMEQTPISDARHGECFRADDAKTSDRINTKLQVLKSELAAMRQMDLNLLKQLIGISQTIKRFQRAEVMRFTRSMSFISQNKNLQHRHGLVERQSSAPHSATSRRASFRAVQSSTEDDIGDSLSSFEDSELGSQSELEESTSSLNIIFTKSLTYHSKFSQSRDLIIPLDLPEHSDQTYEDILSRNIRLWKINSHRQESLEEEVDVL